MRSQDSTSVCDIKYKIVFLGEMNVGKTSIIERFIRGQFQQQNYPTVGIDFLSRNITFQQNNYKLQLWDTAGQQKYRSLVPAYLRDANCGVFVFDLTDQKGLQTIQAWLHLFRDHQLSSSICMLVGNKLDSLQRKISFETAKIFADRESLIYRQVSAKTNQNIINLFETMINHINESKISNIKLPQEKITEEFFFKYNKLKTKRIIFQKVPCCYI